MTFEFNQGVPKECVKWLWDNIGEGNVIYCADDSNLRRDPLDSDAWFYRRVFVPHADPMTEGCYVPTITIKDPKMATLFALRWSNV